MAIYKTTLREKGKERMKKISKIFYETMFILTVLYILIFIMPKLNDCKNFCNEEALDCYYMKMNASNTTTNSNNNQAFCEMVCK